MAVTNPITFHGPELIAAVLFVLSIVAVIVGKYKGLITFGKPIERRECNKAPQGVCDKHTEMILDASRIAQDVSETKSEVMGIRTEIKQMNEKLENIMVYHAIKDGEDLRQRGGR